MTAYLDKLNALGFLLFYPTDETSGTTATDAIGALDGTYTDSPTLNQTSLALNREYASIDCAGGTGGGYIDRADDASFQSAEFTFAILASVDVLENDRAFANYRSINNNGGWTLESRADGSVRCYAYAAGAFRSAFSATGVLVAGEAAFWTILYDGDYVRVYKDGSQVAVSSQFTGSMSYGTGTRSLRIGRHITSGTKINGKLQGPAFADYALSAAEVEELYLSTTLYGSFAATMQAQDAAFAGAEEFAGTFAATMQAQDAAFAGEQVHVGEMAATLAALESAFAGQQEFSGTFAATMQTLDAIFAAAEEFTGSFGASLQVVEAAFVAVMQPEGSFAASLVAPDAAFSGLMHPSGAFAGTLEGLDALFAGMASFVHYSRGRIPAGQALRAGPLIPGAPMRVARPPSGGSVRGRRPSW